VGKGVYFYHYTKCNKFYSNGNCFNVVQLHITQNTKPLLLGTIIFRKLKMMIVTKSKIFSNGGASINCKSYIEASHVIKVIPFQAAIFVFVYVSKYLGNHLNLIGT